MIPVLIADDHAFIRAGVEAVLRPTEYHIVAAVGSGDQVAAAVLEHDPMVCVLDVSMPGGGGIEALKALRRAGDMRPVILLTAMIEDGQLLDAVEAGVDGIVGKEGAEETLVATMDAVLAGNKAIGPEFVQRMLQEQARRKIPSPFAALTPREKTIVSCISRGYRNRDVAAELGITEGTVKVYLHALYQKLHIDNRTELAVLALDNRADLL